MLVDDHELVIAGLKALLAAAPAITVVGEASSVSEATACALRLEPDVVLMDMRLPDGTGVDACREILSARPKCKVLFLTSYADDDSILAAVVAGASGYLLKEIESHALLDAIRTVAAGKSVLDPGVTEQALAWVKSQAQRLKVAALSPQEERVLSLVAEGKTNKEIASDLRLSEKTVKNYLANVFDKLQVTRRSQAVAFYLKR